MSEAPLLFLGNWKMNLGLKEARDFATGLGPFVEQWKKEAAPSRDVIVGIAPQMLQLAALAEGFGKAPFAWVAQNSGPSADGAFTGECSPKQLKDLGVSYALIGHSERRHVFYETEEILKRRVEAALAQGVTPVLCIGETLAQRKEGKTFAVLEGQLRWLKDLKTPSPFPLAYEPVWAIGTGETATPLQAEEAHAFIRGYLAKDFSPERAEKTPILYGGSVKPENAEKLMSQRNLDGLLVGGASMNLDSFCSLTRLGYQGFLNR